MRDLDEVVDLGTAPDDRRAERRPIDRHVRADLHVVLDDDGADLRDLDARLPVLDVAESIAADDGTAVDSDAIAETDVAIERRVAVDDRVHADDNALADDGAGVHDRSIADRRAVLDHRVRTDVDIVAQPHVASDKRGRVNARHRLPRRMKDRQHLRQRERRLFDANQRFARLGNGDRHHDRGRGGRFGLREVLLVFRKHDVSGLDVFYRVDRRHTMHLDAAVADELAVDLLREFRNVHLKCADDRSFSWQTNSISSSSGISRWLYFTVNGFVYAFASSTVSSSSSVP